MTRGKMSGREAQLFLVKASLALSGGSLAFSILAPALGGFYPIAWEDATRLIQVLLPPFFAHLGTASHFLFSKAERATRVRDGQLLSLLTRGPIYVFAGVLVTVIAAYGITNRPEAAPGSGMTIDTFAMFVSAMQGLLAVTTGVMFNYLFPTSAQQKAQLEKGAQS